MKSQECDTLCNGNGQRKGSGVRGQSGVLEIIRGEWSDDGEREEDGSGWEWRGRSPLLVTTTANKVTNLNGDRDCVRLDVSAYYRKLIRKIASAGVCGPLALR